MASQVKPSKKALPAERRVAPGAELEHPEDYKDKFRVSRTFIHLTPCETLIRKSDAERHLSRDQLQQK